MLICLDAGHGGSDPGACGAYSKEKDITLKAVKSLGSILLELGFDVMYTRSADTYIALQARSAAANKANADVFVSVHCNSAADKSANGTETLCYSKCKLADEVQKELIAEIGLRDRGIKVRKDLAVLNSTKMPAILVELAFISNAKEEAILNSNAFINKSTKAIAKGICKCYGVPYIEQEAEMITETVMNICNTAKTVKRILKDGENYVRLRDLDSILNIGYDNTTKRVSVSPK